MTELGEARGNERGSGAHARVLAVLDADVTSRYELLALPRARATLHLTIRGGGVRVGVGTRTKKLRAGGPLALVRTHLRPPHGPVLHLPTGVDAQGLPSSWQHLF